MEWEPLSIRLEKDLRNLQLRATDWLASIPVEHFQRDAGPIFLVAPDYYWASLSAEQRAAQLGIKRDYDRLLELLTVLLAGAPKDLHRELAAADTSFRKWLELETNWSLRPNRTLNLAQFNEDAKALHRIVDIVGASRPHPPIVVPDTNSVMDHPDPVLYRRLVGQEEFVFALLPTVLGELDDLKAKPGNQATRDLVEKAIRRVKGWRNQGSLRDGVTVDKTIVVRAFHQEPDMANTLSWLDPTVKDDRIVASILQLEAEFLGARIVLITNDINLLNKADAAAIQATEFLDS